MGWRVAIWRDFVARHAPCHGESEDTTFIKRWPRGKRTDRSVSYFLTGRIAEHWVKRDSGVFLRVGLRDADAQCRLQKGVLLEAVWPRKLWLTSFPQRTAGGWWRRCGVRFGGQRP